MQQPNRAGSQEWIGAAFVIVVIAMLVIGWRYLSTPAPVTVAKETAVANANAKEQALQDLKEKINADESRHRALSAVVQKHSQEICTSHGDWGMKACDAVAQGQIYVGMTADQVRAAWGEPRSVNSITVRHEQWIYPSKSVDFEREIVTSFQPSR